MGHCNHEHIWRLGALLYNVDSQEIMMSTNRTMHVTRTLASAVYLSGNQLTPTQEMSFISY